MNCSTPDCENPREGTTLFCASHNYENRKAERQAKKVKVIHPVKKVSEKKAEDLKIYPKLKRQFLEHKMVCEVKLDGCTVTATEIHHCSLLASNFLNTKTWKAVDRNCHHKIEFEMSAEERRERNLLTD